jgi:small subunit ribosomal protein S16
MLSLKLSRVGKKKQPQYRLIVTEQHRDPWGKSEIIGHYNPMVNPKIFTVDADRLATLMKNGVRLTTTVNNLLINFGHIKGEKMHKVHISKKRAAQAEKK